MALVQVRRHSEVLKKRLELQVLLPDVGTPPFPTLYLLHGLSDDASGFIRKSRIESYVRELPLIVVMPDGFRGWYTRNEGSFDYARYLTEETVDYVERFFPASSARSMGGLSMGGYGSLLAALHNPGRFRSISSHSGALIPWERNPPLIEEWESKLIFGEQPAGSRHDLLAAARALPAASRPALRFDCGLDDEAWLPINRKVHRELEALGWSHDYSEHPGGHDWDYWDERTRDTLAWHCQHLGVDKA